MKVIIMVVLSIKFDWPPVKVSVNVLLLDSQDRFCCVDTLTFLFLFEDLLFIEKFSNILKSPDVVIYSNKGEVYLRVCDKKNLTTNLVNRKLNAIVRLRFPNN